MDQKQISAYKDKIMNTCGKIILGKEDVILHLLECWLCGGHVLLEDVPGTGKTMLLRAFAAAVGGSFRRIQFTPDLLPSDLTGIQYYNRKSDEFEFRPGPLFASVILADEINRATPRTQSALLEAMEEKQITADGITRKLPEPFMVMATQNPLESYGTFALPEAQTDRFFMRLKMGYMNRSQEMEVMRRKPARTLIEELQPVVTNEETLEVMRQIKEVYVSDDTAGYMMDLIEATRDPAMPERGISARGTIALYAASQARAALLGRDYVIPEDVQDVAVPVLAHRMSAAASMKESEAWITSILQRVPVPTEKV